MVERQPSVTLTRTKQALLALPAAPEPITMTPVPMAELPSFLALLRRQGRQAYGMQARWPDQPKPPRGVWLVSHDT